MRVMASILGILFVQGLQAAPQKVEIDSKLFYHGKKIGAPRILADYGSKAKVYMSDRKSNREYNLEVTPVYYHGKKVKLKYALAIKESENEILSRGIVDLKNSNQGRILLDHGKVELHLNVKDS